MAAPGTIKPWAGWAELDTLIRLIEDKKKFKTALTEITSVTDECNEKIALVGVAEEIPVLHQKAANEHAEAQRLTDEAKAKAEDTQKTAEDKAFETVQMAETRAEEIFAAANQRLEDAASSEREVSRREQAATDRDKVLHEREQKVTAQEAHLQKREDAVAEKETRIRTALGE